MTQPAFHFAQNVPPINGRTRASREASRSGARAVVECWTARQSALLQLLTQAGALTDHELAALLHWPLSSVCSIRNSVREQLEPAGFDIMRWVDGHQTKRTRWRRTR